MNSASFPPSSSHEPPPPPATSPGETESKIPPGPRNGKPWLGLLHWIQENTFAPEWLPEPLRRPLFGYMVGVLVQGVAVSLTLFLLAWFPGWACYTILAVLGVTVVALGWGAGPSFFASLVGTLLVWFAVVPARFSWKITSTTDGVALFLYAVVAVSISLLAGQNERGRRLAQEAAQLLAHAEGRSRVDADHLRTVLEVLPSGVLITNREGQLLAMNRAARTFWGGDIPVGTDITQFPEDKLWWAQSGKPVAPDEMPLVRVLGSGQPVLKEELEMKVQDGQHKVLLYSVAPMRDETGAIAGAIISAQDVSEQRWLEREAAKRAQELEAIFDTITDGIALLDGEGKLVRTNQAFRRLLGFEQHPEYLTLPHDQRIAAFTIRRAQGRPLLVGRWPNIAQLQGTAFTGVDLVIENLDQREVVVNVDGVSLRDRLGNITGYIETYRDVTTRHHMEQRTRETLGTLVAMAEAMVEIHPPAPMVDEEGAAATAVAANTTMTLVAQRLAELTRSVLGCRQVSLAAIDPQSGHLRPITQVGLHPAQESTWWASWSPPQRLAERYGHSIAATLAAGKPARLERPPQPAWDRLFGAQSGWLVPMRLGEELVGILLVDYPEPDHDSAQEDESLLITTLAQLGALVLERDRLLRGWAETRANELVLSETKAQMDMFLGIASHELKTPLTSLKLSLEFSQRRLRKLIRAKNGEVAEGDAGLRAAVEQLDRTAHQMARIEALVNDLVDVSRIQAGKLELRFELTDLVALVREAVEVQQEAVPGRSIKSQRPADHSVLVEVDAGRIEQVVTNFLTNALKYSPMDRPVEVGVDLEVEPGRRVRVWVRDQGPGLPPEEQEHIWERFHRAKGVEVQSGAGVGLGLGLYISRMIVERHQGQVGVESVPGHGATFWFTLPLPHLEEEER